MRGLRGSLERTQTYGLIRTNQARARNCVGIRVESSSWSHPEQGERYTLVANDLVTGPLGGSNDAARHNVHVHTKSEGGQF